MDARNLEYLPNKCFDAILDKGTFSSFTVYLHSMYAISLSGLFDTLLCGQTNSNDISAYLKEMFRVLKSGGYLIIISHGGPDVRLEHIRKTGLLWSVKALIAGFFV